MTETPPERAEAPPLPAEVDDDVDVSTGPARRLLVQFFVIPAFVVGIAVLVFWLFGRMAVDKKSPGELLGEVRTGSRNQRWQAAFELTRRLPALEDRAARAAFAEQVMRAYESAEKDDPRVHRYLALVLGRLGEPQAVPLLEGALGDSDAETKLYALWSLAMIGDPGSASKVRPFLESEDAGLRKTAAYAVGRMEDGDSVSTLKKLLQDAVVDVRWNAALALATLDDPSGKDVLVAMTDREQLRKVPGLSADQQDDALLNGLRGLTLLRDPRATEIGERLRTSDPSLRVRREVAKSLESPAPR